MPLVTTPVNSIITADDEAAGWAKLPQCDSGTATATAGAATLAKYGGVITTEALTTAAAAVYTLTITNTKAAAGQIVMASVTDGTNTQGAPVVVRVTPSASSLVIKVKNVHASEALNGTLKIAYAILG